MTEIIAHRGLLNGPNIDKENKLDSIYECLDLGFSVEIDLWATVLNDSSKKLSEPIFEFGHNYGQYEVSLEDLFKLTNLYGRKLYFHCKSTETLNIVINNWDIFQQSDFFMHNEDVAVLTKNWKIWTYPGWTGLYENSIAVLPERCEDSYNKQVISLMKEKKIRGVCTDFPIKYREKINEVE